MCLGDNEPDGPRRCEGEALARCQRAQANAAEATTTTMVLESERDSLEQTVVELDDLYAALNGTLTPEREAELLDRAERFRHEERLQQLRDKLADAESSTEQTPDDWRDQITSADANVADTRRTWEDAVARESHRQEHPEIVETDADIDARLRSYYEEECRQAGIEPDPDGLSDYISTERMAMASHDEWQAAVREGDSLDRARAVAVENHRGLAETMDLDALDAELEARTTSPEMADLIAARDTARTELNAASAQWDQAKQDVADGKPGALNDLNTARERYEEAFADYKVTNGDLEHYKDCTAQYAGVLGEKDPRPEYTGSTFGTATEVGVYEEGSREWLEARQTGFGGSDIPKLLGQSQYGKPYEVINTKIDAITDEQVAEQTMDRAKFIGSTARGHAWEPVLARQFAAENPELTLQRTKATWKGNEEWQNVNVDGVLVDRDGAPAAIWESKTANNAEDWEGGIPAHYRPQLAHYMDAAGVDRAALTVAIDDHDVRTYWMNRNDPLDPADPDKRTFADRKPEIDEAWAKVKDKRANPPDPNAPPKKNSGTFRFVNNPGSDSSRKTNDDTIRQLATYRGCPPAEAERLIRDNLDKDMKADEAVRHAYRSYKPAADPNRRFVIVDFETNGTHAGKHQIIQTGYQVCDGAGNVHASANTLHNINPKIASSVGTGMVDVHQIRYEQLDGTTPFAKSEQREQLTRLAADPNVTFVAHNANFEMSFLRAHGINTDRVIDTMNLSRKFDHQSTGAKLSDFTAAHGVQYVNAHDAYQDVDMTRRALTNFWAGK
ncbi:YqaJ viral recombinase family protein [Gordonia aichiensis]|uniref:YqaJ viral recombinase family protein n=1 Tax=Gordonia aichiensis TaxID=36820 RepID=UPI003267B0E7